MCARRSDPLDVVEAAYRTTGTQSAWLRGLVTAAHPLLDRGCGVTAYLVNVRDGVPARASSPATIGSPRGWRRAFDAIGNPKGLDPERRVAFRNDPTVQTFSAMLGGTLFATLSETLENVCHPLGMYDWLGMKAMDPGGFGCVLTAPLPRVMSLSPSFTRRWARVAAHVTAGFRLRRALRGAARGASDASVDADAILGPRFELQHATGAARSREARAMLREAAVAIDRARSKLRRAAPDEALSLWRGLVDARWSLVDHFERDGRRYIVARQNAPTAHPCLPLTERERVVVGLAALGHASKLIAYELGLSESAVSACLARAAKKLGARSRAELVTSFASFRGRGE